MKKSQDYYWCELVLLVKFYERLQQKGTNFDFVLGFIRNNDVKYLNIRESIKFSEGNSDMNTKSFFGFKISEEHFTRNVAQMLKTKVISSANDRKTDLKYHYVKRFETQSTLKTENYANQLIIFNFFLSSMAEVSSRLNRENRREAQKRAELRLSNRNDRSTAENRIEASKYSDDVKEALKVSLDFCFRRVEMLDAIERAFNDPTQENEESIMSGEGSVKKRVKKY